MKHKGNALGLMGAIVLLGMIAYFGFNVLSGMFNRLQTATVVTATMTDSSQLSGLVLRNETVLSETDSFVEAVVSDGEKVAANETVAIGYTSEDALERATYLNVLEQEIADVSQTLEDADSTTTDSERESTVYAAVMDLSQALRSGNYSAAETQAGNLQGALFRMDTSDATEDYLQQLQSEYDQESAKSLGETHTITTDTAGTFSTVLDGFENITPDDARTLTPTELRELLAGDRTVEEGAFGKIITSYYWYYAAIMSQEDASRLVAGRTVQVSFGRYYSDILTADVEYVGYAENHEQLVLLRMDKGFDDMLAARAVSADLIYSEYTGLRVPLSALYRYYAAYVDPDDADLLNEGEEVTLNLGGVLYTARVSDIGSPIRYGNLAEGIEADSEEDTRPSHCAVVFYWPWSADENAPDFSDNQGTVTTKDGSSVISLDNYYTYNADTDRLCVFTLTGSQAERKKVDLLFAGDEYCLVTSEGTDALREGNEVISSARNLFNGKVFQ